MVGFDCPECLGDGWILVERMSLDCCGQFLPSGECCAARYGEANPVAVPVQDQAACPSCGGTGEWRVAA